MKTIILILLAIFAALLTGSGFALTAEPNIINGTFENPVLTTSSDPDVVDWWEGQGFNQWSGVSTRKWNSSNFNGGTQPGLNCAQMVTTNDCIFQPVALFKPNSTYQVSCVIQKRDDQVGPAGRIELWAGGSYPLPPDNPTALNTYYGSAGFPLTVAGATLVDSVSFDYSDVGLWTFLWEVKSFTLTTGLSHTTSDPLYLLFVKTGGGQMGIDDVTMVDVIPEEPDITPDITRDTFVDLEDFWHIARHWLTNCSTDDCVQADINSSGQVEIGDVALLAESWLQFTVPGLIGWWKLDEGTGSVAYDRLGINDATIYYTEENDWIPSELGYFLGLDGQAESDGNGEFIYLPRLIQDDFSIAFWVRTTKIGDDGDQWWSGKGMVDADRYGIYNDFGIALVDDKAAFGVGGTDIGDVTIKSTTPVSDGYWHQITATRDGTFGQMNLYLDGILEATGTGSTGPKNAQSRILVGSLNFRQNQYLRGYFDDIRFYDRAITAEEVASLTHKDFPSVTPKKGVGSGNIDRIHALNVEWIYNWNISVPAGMDSSIDYVPMRHNKYWPSLDNLATVGDVDYLLGHNEPDAANQANMTVAEVVAQWPALQAKAVEYDLQLGSPSTTHYNDQWLIDFMNIVDAPGSGLWVDFMAIHWYYPPNVDNFMNNMQWVHNQWGRDVWVTEFNVADWDGNNQYTQEQSYTFLAELLWRMDQTSWLKRYAIFPWDGSSEASKASPIFEPGTNNLTPLGKLYASWDGDIDGPNQNTWYYINHESSHQRIHANGTGLEMATIFSMGDGSQWELIDAGDNWYYIENKGFTQRLGYDSGTGNPAAVSDSETGDDVKWKLVHSEYGWYCIDHKVTGRRLQYDSTTGITLVSGSPTDTKVKWRFIKP